MENISWKDHKTNKYVLDQVKKNAFKHCIRNVIAMAWTHLDKRESCERGYRGADGRKERKRKATYHYARRYQDR